MGGVLEQQQVVPPRDVRQLVHAARLPAVVDGHNRLRPRRDLRLDLLRVDVVVVEADVGEDGLRALEEDRVDGGAEGERRRDHLVALADAGGHEHEMQARRAGADGDGVLAADVVAEALLEEARLRAGRQPAGADGIDDLRDLLFGDVRLAERQRRKLLCRCRHCVVICLSSHRRSEIGFGLSRSARLSRKPRP